MTAEACVRMSKESGIEATFRKLGKTPRVRLPMSGSLLERPTDDLPLSVRSRNALMRAGLFTVDRLTDYIRENGGLTGIRNLGKVSIQEVKLTLIQTAYDQLSEREKIEFWNYALS